MTDDKSSLPLCSLSLFFSLNSSSQKIQFLRAVSGGIRVVLMLIKDCHLSHFHLILFNIQRQNQTSMAISESTQAVKIEEVLHNLQQSWVAFKDEIKNQMFEQQDQEKKINGTMNELITGLSQKVLQMSNQFHEVGNQISPKNSGSSYSNLSRISRVDFPKFEGHDVQGWIYKCEPFFGVVGTPENVKVKIASIHLDGKALLWHQSFMRSFALGQWPTWEGYREAIMDLWEGLGSNPLMIHCSS